jgi:hypothetical protein
VVKKRLLLLAKVIADGSADQQLLLLNQIVALMVMLNGVLTLAHILAQLHHLLSLLIHSAIHRTLELLLLQCGQNALVRNNLSVHPTAHSPTELLNIQQLDSALLEEYIQILLSWQSVVLLITILVLALPIQNANGTQEKFSEQMINLVLILLNL